MASAGDAEQHNIDRGGWRRLTDRISRLPGRVARAIGRGLGRFFRASPTQPPARYASPFGIAAGGVAFIVFGIAFFSVLVNLWPVVELTGARANGQHAVTLGWGAYSVHVSKTTGLLLLALLMGAIGGYVHAATSFVSYLGNRQFKASWGWWYVLRALIGAALALFAYVALRGGFLTGSTSSSTNINAYGVATICGLVGLFSKQATDKLEEIFNTAFHTKAGIGDEQRRDSITPDTPTVNALEPHVISISNPGPIAIKGAGFEREAPGKKAIVKIDGAQVPSVNWRSETEIALEVPSALLSVGTLRVTVMNLSNEATSPAAQLHVVP